MTLKVLHIIPSLAKGGAERLVLDICSELKKRKDVEVKLVVFRDENDYSFLTEHMEYLVIPTIVNYSVSGKEYIDNGALTRFIDDYQPHIIHSHLFETEIVLSSVLYNKCRYIVHFHDNMRQFRNLRPNTFFKKQRLTDFYEKQKVVKAYGKRDVTCIAISGDTMAYAQRSVPAGHKVVLLYNAIDLERFSAETLQSKADSLTVTTIGSLIDRKGHELAIEAMEVLIKRSLRLKLMILGDGPNRNKLSGMIEEKGLNEYVTLVGKTDFPETYLKASFCYLHTAWREPFGLVLVEAMAVGLPVVSTDAVGNRDLVLDGENGCLIKSRDPEIVADKLEQLYKDQALRMRLAENATTFSKKFDIKTYVDKLLEVYTSKK